MLKLSNIHFKTLKFEDYLKFVDCYLVIKFHDHKPNFIPIQQTA